VAQAKSGYAESLWEGWEELVGSPAPKVVDPLAKGDLWDILAPVFEPFGIGKEDLLGVGEGDEMWGPEEDVFMWENGKGNSKGGVVSGPRGKRGVGGWEMGGEGDRGKQDLPGIALEGINLRDIHLVPVTGADGWAGERLPFINVRAKCTPQERQLADRSPWA